MRLFKINDVKSVFLGADFVTVGETSFLRVVGLAVSEFSGSVDAVFPFQIGKETTGDWSAIKPQVFALLMDAFAEEGWVFGYSLKGLF